MCRVPQLEEQPKLSSHVSLALGTGQEKAEVEDRDREKIQRQANPIILRVSGT